MKPYLFFDGEKSIEEYSTIEETGQTLIEYALIILLVVIVVIGTLTIFGESVHDLYQAIKDTIIAI